MKEEDQLDEFLEKIRIPSNQEVELAGIRFERRVKRIKLRRRMTWVSSSVAAIIIAAIMIPSLFMRETECVVIDNTRIVEPTLILSDGNRVKLEHEEINTSNIRVSNNHISYDSVRLSSEEPFVPKEIEYNTLVIPAGYVYDVTLADGSRVTLNAGSRLKYPVEFRGDLREVELSGEAYFQVEKSEKPFEVNVSGSKIRVYGTRFNVKTLLNNNMMETVLVEGSIGFITPSNEEIRVVPGEQVSFDVKTGKIGVRQVNTGNATAWLNGAFKYQDRRLDLVLEDISAWYDVEFESRIDVTSIELTMNLSKKTPIDEVISFLELMTSLTIIKEGGRYIIK